MHRINRKSRIMELYCCLVTDMLAILISYFLAYLIRFGFQIEKIASRTISTTESVLLVILLFCTLYSIITDWNRGFFYRNGTSEFWFVGKYIAVMAVIIASWLFFTKAASAYSRLMFGLFLVFDYFITVLFHIIIKKVFITAYHKGNTSDKVMVVTDYAHLDDVLGQVIKHKEWNYDITSLTIIDRDMVGKKINDIPILANEESLVETARQIMLDEVFLYIPDVPMETAKNIIMDIESMGIVCHYSIDISELNIDGKTAGNFAGFPVMTFCLKYDDFRRKTVKRVVDIIGSLIGLTFTGIIFPFIAIAIKIESRGPVIFSQIRIGKNGRRFKIYKFRSMYTNAEERKKELMAKNEMNGLMFKMDKDPRVTKVGRFLRKTSIDELPQFYNVFVGDMSLVGTRPPTVDEFEKYNIHYRRRLCITPGLTGMWQTSGRSKISNFDEVVELDMKYIDNWSLMLDMQILLKTIFVVLFGYGSK